MIYYIVIAYFVIGVLWSAYAGRMQFKTGISCKVDKEFCLCVLGNLVIWPVGMFFAWLFKGEDDPERDL